MRAGWWWIDRWQKSTAYKDMTLSEQGAYRNLLDELWLRGGVLPDNERILARLCGDPLEWATVRKAVMARFTRGEGGWRNETHDEVSGESSRRAEKQRRYRNGRGNNVGNAPGNKDHNVTPSPDPSPDPSPISGSDTPPPPKGGVACKSEKRHLCRKDVAGTDLDSPDFLEAWSDWEKVHGKYKPLGIKGQVTRLSEWGHDRAVAAVRYSIAQGSQGVYEERGNNGHATNGAYKTQAECALEEWARKTTIQ